jgi:hypothetical protein
LRKQGYTQPEYKQRQRTLERLEIGTANFASLEIGQRKVRKSKTEHQPDRAIREDGPGRQMNSHRTNKGFKERLYSLTREGRQTPLEGYDGSSKTPTIKEPRASQKVVRYASTQTARPRLEWFPCA